MAAATRLFAMSNVHRTQLAALLWLLLLLVRESNAFCGSAGGSPAAVSLGATRPRTRTRWSSPSSCLHAAAAEQGSDDDDFMKDLRSRMNQVSDRETKLPIVVVDSILPRQVLKIEADDPTFNDLIRTVLQDERPFFGMVGVATLNTGQTLPLQNGCEVEIMGKPHIVNGTALRVDLQGRRRFRILGELETTDTGWSQARVRYFDSAQEEAEEEQQQLQQEQTGGDVLSLARARSHARELVSPNMNMPGGVCLIDRWIELARQNEREPGQIDQLLKDLGERSSADQATELALYVGALINPLPGMGVAMEIRPALLMSRTTEERVLVALKGITESIKHMDGSRRLF